MHELQQKDKKVVLSAKALETIYHMASSSIGKLISGKQYLGGYALEQVRYRPVACRLTQRVLRMFSKFAASTLRLFLQ